MKKNILTVLAVLTLGFGQTTQAQDAATPAAPSAPASPWKKGASLGINVSDAGFNDSWKGGGVNNTALGFVLNAKAERTEGKGVWTNDLQLNYGNMNADKKGFRKNIDRIFFDSKYARKISDKLNWFVAGNLLTQFAPGLNYDDANKKSTRISNFLAPGFLSEGLGIEYKPVKYFTLQFGGATLRQTFVQDNAAAAGFMDINKKTTAYGVNIPIGDKMLNELGFNITGIFDKDIAKNVNLKWRYTGFSALSPTSKPVDHRLDLTATAKISDLFNVNFTFIGIQDKDVITDWQTSRGFNIGMLYTPKLK